jgi:pimeloyl-ACP methyl ester carboxylesterase
MIEPMPPPRPRLVLFSGIGVDARLVAQQAAIDAQVEVPRWMTPIDGESLAQYAQRFAQQIDPAPPLFVGGVSFGGMVAQEVARHIPVQGLVLLATCRSWRGVPIPYRLAGRLAVHAPLWPVALAIRAATRLKSVMGLTPSEARRRGDTLEWFDAMLADTDPAFLRWAGAALATWPGAGPLRVPHVHLHGGHDLVLPARYTSPTHLIPHAGHLINVTHAQYVNAVVEEFLKHHTTAANATPPLV